MHGLALLSALHQETECERAARHHTEAALKNTCIPLLISYWWPLLPLCLWGERPPCGPGQWPRGSTGVCKKLPVPSDWALFQIKPQCAHSSTCISTFMLCWRGKRKAAFPECEGPALLWDCWPWLLDRGKNTFLKVWPVVITFLPPNQNRETSQFTNMKMANVSSCLASAFLICLHLFFLNFVFSCRCVTCQGWKIKRPPIICADLFFYLCIYFPFSQMSLSTLNSVRFTHCWSQRHL